MGAGGSEWGVGRTEREVRGGMDSGDGSCRMEETWLLNLGRRSHGACLVVLLTLVCCMKDCLDAQGLIVLALRIERALAVFHHDNPEPHPFYCPT